VIPARGTSLWGIVASGAKDAEILGCGYALIHDLGDVESFDDVGDLTMLETLIVGGAPLGFDEVPGLHPDVDLDDDGFERFVLDAEGHIEACVDGDSTHITGRDCWLDPRMADGFSMSLSFKAISARFAGRYPGWEDLVQGDCENPPEESLFDPR
jgi:hypothetical protein